MCTSLPDPQPYFPQVPCGRPVVCSCVPAAAGGHYNGRHSRLHTGGLLPAGQGELHSGWAARAAPLVRKKSVGLCVQVVQRPRVQGGGQERSRRSPSCFARTCVCAALLAPALTTPASFPGFAILGCKLNNVPIVYTPWANLKKTADMDIGQVGLGCWVRLCLLWQGDLDSSRHSATPFSEQHLAVSSLAASVPLCRGCGILSAGRCWRMLTVHTSKRAAASCAWAAGGFPRRQACAQGQGGAQEQRHYKAAGEDQGRAQPRPAGGEGGAPARAWLYVVALMGACVCGCTCICVCRLESARADGLGNGVRRWPLAVGTQLQNPTHYTVYTVPHALCITRARHRHLRR